MITTEFKQRVITALKADRENYSNDVKHSRVLDLNTSQYSRIAKGDFEKVISKGKWISLARILNVGLSNKKAWVTVKTETFNYINIQLNACQSQSISGILCDRAGIGKTHAAKYYCRNNKNAIYVDCSQVKSKQKFIKKIAREFGINFTGRYADVYDDLIYYIQSIENPLIVLDEAGDLENSAFLEIKALWNATEYTCGWYMMGADALKKKIDSRKDSQKVGYAEIFDRFGNTYSKITKGGTEQNKAFNMNQIHLIAKANNSPISAPKLYALSLGSLRKIKNEIEKAALKNDQ
ncbi:MAG: AAA family ATPase [Flavobacteriales bacterium]